MKIDAAVFEKLFDVLDILSPPISLARMQICPLWAVRFSVMSIFRAATIPLPWQKHRLKNNYVLPQFPDVQVGIVK